jgi:hypothetical protein
VSQVNGDKVKHNYVTSTTFRKKTKEHLEEKINETEINSKINTSEIYRGM